MRVALGRQTVGGDQSCDSVKYERDSGLNIRGQATARRYHIIIIEAVIFDHHPDPPLRY